MENIIQERKRHWRELYAAKGRRAAVILIGQNYGERPLPYPENKVREALIKCGFEARLSDMPQGLN